MARRRADSAMLQNLVDSHIICMWYRLMMTGIPQRFDVIKLLEDVVSGTLVTQQEFDQRLQENRGGLEEHEVIAIHQAQHYISDADIRLRDAGYERLQKADLLTLVADLRGRLSSE